MIRMLEFVFRLESDIQERKERSLHFHCASLDDSNYLALGIADRRPDLPCLSFFFVQ